MAKRQVTRVQIDGVEYSLSTLYYFNNIESYVVYGEYETSTNLAMIINSDFAPVKADASLTTSYNTNLGSAKFKRTIASSTNSLNWTNASGGSWISTIPYNGSGTHVYYAIVLDDTAEEAWIVAKVYQNNTFDKMIISYGGAEMYASLYLAEVHDWTNVALHGLDVSPAGLDRFFNLANGFVEPNTTNLDYNNMTMNIVSATYFENHLDMYIIGDSSAGIYASEYNASYISLQFYYGGNSVAQAYVRRNTDTLIIAGVNDYTHLGTFYTLYREGGFSGNPPYSTTYTNTGTDNFETTAMYNVLKALAVPPENTLTVQILNNHIVFKMYTGSTVIYQWTSPVGSSTADVVNIYAGFLKDDANQVAKPSFIYNNNGTYLYNQEEPTDAEMALIYNWLSAREVRYDFDYTGTIQEFTVPETGVYEIETWGAQGGNATDGSSTARGGYGAYAKGEVSLTQGETLYIGVGGQNGFNGGGNYVPPNNE